MSEATETQTKKPFWETLPGILTSVATVLTALTGLLALFIQSKKDPTSPPAVIEKKDRDNQPKEKRIRVTGLWTDPATGTQVQMQQQGNSITFATLNPMTGQRMANGWGTLSGRRIRGQNNWFTGLSYSFDMSVSDDGDEITGTYRGLVTAEAGNIHLTR